MYLDTSSRSKVSQKLVSHFEMGNSGHIEFSRGVPIKKLMCSGGHEQYMGGGGDGRNVPIQTIGKVEQNW